MDDFARPLNIFYKRAIFSKKIKIKLWRLLARGGYCWPMVCRRIILRVIVGV